MNALAPLLLLQLLNAPGQEADPYQRRITPEVQVVQKVAPSVVYITTEGPERRFRDLFGRVYTDRPVGSGSGVVIHEDGYIVTNYHVIQGVAQGGRTGKIRVEFDRTHDPDGGSYEARLLSAERAEDLALLKIEGDEPFPPAELGTSSDLMIGERVLAIGNPYGQTHTVSMGIISGLHRDVDVQELHFEDLIQTDAAINPGNSGGALVNINGRLIGINTVMNTRAENIGFAIPVDRVRQVLQERLLSPSLARSWLGFDVDLDTLRVERVLAGSPAAEAGVAVGDRITRIGEQEVDGPDAYRFARLEVRPGEEVAIGLRRGDEELAVTVDAWDRVRGLLFTRLGMGVEEQVMTSGWFTQKRLRVSAVRDDGPAAELGLAPGDIVDALTPEGGRYVQPRTAAELAILVNGLEPGTRVEIGVWRDVDEDGRLERDADYSELFQGPLVLE